MADGFSYASDTNTEWLDADGADGACWPAKVAEPFLPYGRQTIEDDDVAAVAAALRADFLTTGPRVEAFEDAFAAVVGARHAVACSNGTAALHLAMLALDVQPGEAVHRPGDHLPATANCARYSAPRWCSPTSTPTAGLMTPETLAEAIGRLRRAQGCAAVLPVHLRGDVVDLPALRRLADEAGRGAGRGRLPCAGLGHGLRQRPRAGRRRPPCGAWPASRSIR